MSTPARQAQDAEASDFEGIQTHMFSRAHVGAQGVVMPSRALTRPNATKQEIINYHSNEGNLPHAKNYRVLALVAPGTEGL